MIPTNKRSRNTFNKLVDLKPAVFKSKNLILPFQKKWKINQVIPTLTLSITTRKDRKKVQAVKNQQSRDNKVEYKPKINSCIMRKVTLTKVGSLKQNYPKSQCSLREAKRMNLTSSSSLANLQFNKIRLKSQHLQEIPLFITQLAILQGREFLIIGNPRKLLNSKVCRIEMPKFHHTNLTGLWS